MLYRTFGKTGWKVSVVGFGAWGISGQWGEVDDATAVETVRAAFDAGVNVFDSADSYGEPPGRSEELLGKALHDVRDKVYLVTKVGYFASRAGHNLPYTHPLHIELCCDASLHRLRTDTIDLYLCHRSGIDNFDIFIEAFEALLTKGKIRYYGISTNHMDKLELFNENGKCAGAQIEYCYLNRLAEKDLFPYCREHNIGTMIRGPLGQGICADKFTRDTKFTDWVRQKWNNGERREEFLKSIEIVEKLRFLKRPDRTMAQAALQFAFSHPAVTTLIPGARNPDQARANAAAGNGELTPEEVEQIQALTPDKVLHGYG